LTVVAPPRFQSKRCSGVDLGTQEVEIPELVATRLCAALGHIAPDRLLVAPDRGMKHLPREIAVAKLKAMVAGVDIVRAEITERAVPAS
jgi:5-methyltetrahydropteroyltriglutamate--homocysteine methyltransferase